jgi:hypothetical protein
VYLTRSGHIIRKINRWVKMIICFSFLLSFSLYLDNVHYPKVVNAAGPMELVTDSFYRTEYGGNWDMYIDIAVYSYNPTYSYINMHTTAASISNTMGSFVNDFGNYNYYYQKYYGYMQNCGWNCATLVYTSGEALQSLPYPIGYSYTDSSGQFLADRLLIHQSSYRSWEGYGVRIYRQSKNSGPILTLQTADNQLLAEEVGLNEYKLEGFVQDVDNDTLNLTAEFGGATKSLSIANTSVAKPFVFNFDVLADRISAGVYQAKVTANDGKGGITTKTLNVTVKKRIKNYAYIILNTPVYYDTIYTDPEDDIFFKEQYKFTHHTLFFQNSTGMIPDSGIWRDIPYYSFAHVGHYEAVYRAKDNPKLNNLFDDYRYWSRESFSQINFYVHRKPVPIFSVRTTANPGSGNYIVATTEASYDLDHQTQTNKGIYAREWQYKLANAATWTNGQPPATLPINQDYILRLRVQDIDGLNGIGVWSDWKEQAFTTMNRHLPPVAQFTIIPGQVSHAAASTINITDQSYSPVNYTPLTYEWKVTKQSNGQVIHNSSAKPTSAQLKSGGIAKYDVTLRVSDSMSLWSQPYVQSYEVINNPPVADFEIPEEVSRDTSITPVNQTTDLDGGTITYRWTLFLEGVRVGASHFSTTAQPTFTIQSMISLNSLYPPTSISDGWSLELRAADAMGAFSTATKDFTVLNNAPVAIANGPTNVGQHTTHAFTSGASDSDSADQASLIYNWTRTKPSGQSEISTLRNVSFTFEQSGIHHIEHYAVDQIGVKSNVAVLDVVVNENLAPTMLITSPNGSVLNPTRISGQPLIHWNYSDPESDLQEKFSFDYYEASNDLLMGSLTQNDALGSLRQYQFYSNSFAKREVYSLVGRVYSKFKWSELSNKVFFQINEPPAVVMTIPDSPDHLEPTIINDLTPDLTWEMADPDNDAQVRYRLIIRKQSNGTMMFDSGVVSTNALSRVVPASANLIEYETYSAEVQVYDGYDWSEYSETTYFQVILNSPPVPAFDWSPKPVWEGDTIHLINQSTDPDGDPLTYSWHVSGPGGYLQTAVTTHVSRKLLQPGDYAVTLTVSDGKVQTNLTRTLRAESLLLDANVSHTAEWLTHHLQQGHETVLHPKSFYTGEIFVVSAVGSLAATSRVTASLDSIGRDGNPIAISVDLAAASQANHYQANLYEAILSSLTGGLPEGQHQIKFIIEYTNGVVKDTSIPIQIIGHVQGAVNVHRRQ